MIDSRGRIQARILGLFAMRPGEWRRALLTFGYLYLVICSYILIKTIRSALFISEYSAMKLPYAMVFVPLLVAIFAAVYIRLARRVGRVKLIGSTVLFFALNVLGFWLLARGGRPWVAGAFYVWAGLYGVIAPTQVWTLANDLFTTREAKRLFGFIGAGGLLGALTSSVIADRFAAIVGTIDLLLVVVGMLVATAGIVVLLGRMRPPGQPEPTEPPPDLAGALGQIVGSRHLRLLALLVFITALATTSADFQFNLVADAAIDETDALTAFFGRAYGALSLIAFVFQLLATSRVLKVFGVGMSILVLPLSLLGGTAWLLAAPTLLGGFVLKASDGAFKHSLDRSAREMLYLPVPARVKITAKATIDTLMDRLGDGVAGALQLLLTAGLGLGLRGSLVVNVPVIGLWVLAALRLRREYVGQLRAALGRFGAPTPEVPVAVCDAECERIVVQVLADGTEREKLAALEWAARLGAALPETTLLELARADPSPGVRRGALSLLLGGRDTDLPAELVDGLEREQHAALVAAIDLLAATDASPDAEQRLQALLDDASTAVRLPLVAYMLRRLGPEFGPFARQVIEALLGPTLPRAVRLDAARSLALLPDDERLRARLSALLDDPDPEVAAEAARAAGRAGRLDLVERLIERLGRPGMRRGVGRGLRELGDAAVPALSGAMQDSRRPIALRRRVPSALARLDSSRAVEALVAGLRDPDAGVRDRCLDALHRLRRANPGFPLLSRRALALEIAAQAERLATLEACRVALDPLGGAPAPWLRDVVAEAYRSTLRRIFRLLALGYPVRDMDRAWRALADAEPAVRANAVELLDTQLPQSVSRSILPVLEGHRRANDPVLTLDGVVRRLAAWPDGWVAACAFQAARAVRVDGLKDLARVGALADDPALREEASRYLSVMLPGQ